MLILSFDFGEKNIGVAIGQTITCTANALNIIKVKKGIPDWKNISDILKLWQPKLIIVGYPLNMDGTEQNFTKKVKKFSRNLYNRYLINIELHDERLTTMESKSILYNNKSYKKLKNNYIHSLSAVLILESWLNKKIFNKLF